MQANGSVLVCACAVSVYRVCAVYALSTPQERYGTPIYRGMCLCAVPCLYMCTCEHSCACLHTYQPLYSFLACAWCVCSSSHSFLGTREPNAATLLLRTIETKSEQHSLLSRLVSIQYALASLPCTPPSGAATSLTSVSSVVSPCSLGPREATALRHMEEPQCPEGSSSGRSAAQ